MATLVFDPTRVTRTKTLGYERTAREVHDALPDGRGQVRAAVWELMRPMLSPALVARNRDAFLPDARVETTVDLAGHSAVVRFPERSQTRFAHPTRARTRPTVICSAPGKRGRHRRSRSPSR